MSIKAVELMDRQLDDLSRELNNLNQQAYEIECQMGFIQDDIENYLTNNFVGLKENETFSNHMDSVEYTNGYYQSISKATQDGNTVVFNLKGEKVN